MELYSGNTWLTNDPEAAAKLRAADERYERLRLKMPDHVGNCPAKDGFGCRCDEERERMG